MAKGTMAISFSSICRNAADETEVKVSPSGTNGSNGMLYAASDGACKTGSVGIECDELENNSDTYTSAQAVFHSLINASNCANAVQNQFLVAI